jgi:hypothetical protein
MKKLIIIALIAAFPAQAKPLSKMTCKELLLESSSIAMECKGYDAKTAPAMCSDYSPERLAIDAAVSKKKCEY